MIDAFLYPLFVFPLILGLVLGIGLTMRVYRRGRFSLIRPDPIKGGRAQKKRADPAGPAQ